MSRLGFDTNIYKMNKTKRMTGFTVQANLERRG